jgi:hypothetical protein
MICILGIVLSGVKRLEFKVKFKVREKEQSFMLLKANFKTVYVQAKYGYLPFRLGLSVSLKQLNNSAQVYS